MAVRWLCEVAYVKTPARTSAQSVGVVFMNGFRSVMDANKPLFLEKFCAERGYSFLRFDWRGHGQSNKHVSVEDCTISMWLDDALSVVDQLTEGKQVLVGSSLGGWIAFLVALKRPERVAGIVGIGIAPDFTEHLFLPRLSAQQKTTLEQEGSIRLPSAYDEQGYVYTKALVDDAQQHLILKPDAKTNVSCPVRLLHGILDVDVPWQHSLRVIEHLSTNDATLTLVKDGNHRLSREQDLHLIAQIVDQLIRT